MLRRNRLPVAGARGFTLVEVMITITVLGILLAIGLPSMRQMLQNSQVRTAAETTLAGLQFARTEAIRRNESIRFQFVSDLTSGCTVSASGTSWVVNLAGGGTPAGKCDTTPIDPSTATSSLASGNPGILQVKSGAESTAKATISATSGGAAANLVTFNGVGRATTGSVDTINIQHVSDACDTATGGTVRCLRILVSTGGIIKMCDPSRTDTTDPRFCAL